MCYILKIHITLSGGRTFEVRSDELLRDELLRILRDEPGDMGRFHVFRIADEAEAGYWSGEFSLCEPASIVSWRLRPVRGRGRSR